MSAALNFFGGLVGLLAAGHLVVGRASSLGRRFGLTPMVIGLTIVAAGTSAPELAVVSQSIASNDTELAVGSIIGSNIANVLLVLGLAAAFGAIVVDSRVVRIDIPVMIAASLALLLMAQDGRLGRTDGIMLFGGLLVFVTWTLIATREPPGSGRGGDEAPTTAKRPSAGQPSLIASIAGLIVGIAALAFAARFVVSGAEDIALSLGVPELIIGLTILAIGTSAPEIVTTAIAALNGHRELAVGNAVGSNIFNILLVLGATTALAPAGIGISDDAIRLDLPILLAVAVACLPMVFFDNKLDRWEGALFVAYYVAYLAFLVLDATGHRAKDPFVFIMAAFVGPLTVITAATIIVRQKRRGALPTESHRTEPIPIKEEQHEPQSTY